MGRDVPESDFEKANVFNGQFTDVLPKLNIYLTTLLTSPIEFSLYFQNYVSHLYQTFREVRKVYETGLRSKIMRVNLFS